MVAFFEQMQAEEGVFKLDLTGLGSKTAHGE
jgi:hypothetical protein